MAAIKIYEYVEGLHVDSPLYDNEKELVPIAIILASKFFVIKPGAVDEEEWVTSLVEPNIIRHTVPDGAGLVPGRYKVQPYIETVDGYKGRCEPFEFKLEKNFK